MIREYRGPAPHHDCVVIGNILTIDGADYDLDVLQTDSQQVIDIVAKDMFVANIIIPPASYKTVVDGEVETQVQQPVELGRVKIILWTKAEEVSDDNNHN